MNVEHWWNHTDTGYGSIRTETCSNTTTSTTNPMWNGVGPKPPRRDVGTDPRTVSSDLENEKLYLGFWVWFFHRQCWVSLRHIRMRLPFCTLESSTPFEPASQACRLNNCSGDQKPGGWILEQPSLHRISWLRSSASHCQVWSRWWPFPSAVAVEPYIWTPCLITKALVVKFRWIARGIISFWLWTLFYSPLSFSYLTVLCSEVWFVQICVA